MYLKQIELETSPVFPFGNETHVRVAGFLVSHVILFVVCIPSSSSFPPTH